MYKTITLSNGVLTAAISTKGAELISLKKDDFENIWDGNPDIWPKHSPVPFPICGRLVNGKYTYDGKEYELGMHGFGPTSEYEVEKQTDTSVTFLLKDSEETMQVYPFCFEFRVCYTLVENSLEVSYNVTNKDSKKMYFSIGSHEAYSCPEGIEEYSVLFSEKEDLEYSILENAFLSDKIGAFGICGELPLKYDYFDIDTLIFRKIKTKDFVLKNRTTGRQIRIFSDDADNLLVWTKKEANYICLELWCGLPDHINTDGDITKKVGILSLEPQKALTRKHTITF